jgi:hypothetical protein
VELCLVERSSEKFISELLFLFSSVFFNTEFGLRIWNLHNTDTCVIENESLVTEIGFSMHCDFLFFGREVLLKSVCHFHSVLFFDYDV